MIKIMNPEKNIDYEFSAENDLNELLKSRLAMIKEIDGSLEISDKLAGGETSEVYDCTKRDSGDAEILKVSKMPEGISKQELKALQSQQDINGIPKLKDHYQKENLIIALRLKKIIGDYLNKYASEHPELLPEVLGKIRTIISDIHDHGYQMPRDWLKNQNLIIEKNNQPNVVDLGEQNLISEDQEQAEFEINNDIRSFHNLIYKHLDTAKGKTKRALERIILEDTRII